MERRIDCVERKVSRRVDEVEGRVVRLEKERDECSSMVSYLKKNPKGELGWLAVLVVILSFWLAAVASGTMPLAPQCSRCS